MMNIGFLLIASLELAVATFKVRVYQQGEGSWLQ